MQKLRYADLLSESETRSWVQHLNFHIKVDLQIR